MVGKIFRASVATLIALVVAVGLTYFMVSSWSSQPINVGEGNSFDFPRGTSLTELTGTLATHGLIDRPLFFQLLVKFERTYPSFQAGTYKFAGEVSPRQIIETIRGGKVFIPVALQYTIPEGFTLRQVSDRLVANRVGKKEAIDNLLFDTPSLRRELKVGKSFEGFLYPATYSFRSMPSPKEAITRMAKTFFENLPKDYRKRLKDHGLSLTKAVKIASLIELETKFDDERNAISEVIHNRLRSHQRLAIDAALIYGIKDYKGDITWKHLKDAKNPYNTRIHYGLPPTAIGAVSTASLEAVLSPTKLGYYYYVVDPDNLEGRHHFSKTLAEHNRYVRKLVKRTKRVAKDGQR